jgi:signal transduction histidine kinase/CheY-like chemotaxis protein
MLPPKSPLDKPSSQSRRTGGPQRSSSDTSTTQSSSLSSKHGIRGGNSSLGKTKDQTSDTPPVTQTDGKSSSKSTAAKGAGGQGPDTHMQEISNPLPGISRRPAGVDGQFAQAAPPEIRERGSKSQQWKGNVPKNVSPEEVERLHAEMDAQLRLNQHREKLAMQLGENEARSTVPTGGKTRVSPIHEETISPSLDASFASPISTQDTSPVSSGTIGKGGSTPGVVPARTPSYPFPPMRTPGQIPYNAQRTFIGLSPTVPPTTFPGVPWYGPPHDQVLSGSITPASTVNFHPGDAHKSQGNSKFATPNLYDVSLMLTAEPGLDAWWTAVVQIMRDMYKADRVTLSVPADSTDVENVPWGQKATFNVIEEDALSLSYLPRGSSMVPSSVDMNEVSTFEDTNADEYPSTSALKPYAARPDLLSRHSFTSFEDSKQGPASFSEGRRSDPSCPPPPMLRAKSSLAAGIDLLPQPSTPQNVPLGLQFLQDQTDFEDINTSAKWENSQDTSREVRGRVFSVLQALDYEADPLIDSSGVLRVLERGKVIALTRDYPYLDNPANKKIGDGKPSQPSVKSRENPVDKTKKGILSGKSSQRPTRNVRSHTLDKRKSVPTPGHGLDDPPPHIPRYEEYEQAPPSPWSQSPAPSPAVRAETGENLFFGNASIDEETFNPNTPLQDYTKNQPLEAIGVDRSWTVLHIPLLHPLLSKPVQSFRLDAAAIESKSVGREKADNRLPKFSDPGKPSRDSEPFKEKRTPIAIVSILSPVIPYPSNLRHSLEHLAPHLATSFSLCRHYSSLENEIAGLSRKRPQAAGFGAVAAGSRSIGDQTNIGHGPYSPADDSAHQPSLGSSITSPSDYSGISKSAAGSPRGTPGWGPDSVFLGMDIRSSGESPAYSVGESYFAPGLRPSIGRVETGSVIGIIGVRRGSKETSAAEMKMQHRPQSAEDRLLDFEIPSTEHRENLPKGLPDRDGKHSSTPTPKQEAPSHPELASNPDSSDNRDGAPQVDSLAARVQTPRVALGQRPGKTEHPHTQLHSYGAEFGATFQSLPTTSTTSGKGPTTALSHSRSQSLSVPTDMPPPSDRLKGLMLDSLPAHVFVALPQTGEIVWVNSRYLTYRGQSVPELYEDPWGSIHPDERDEYLKAWSHAVRTGEQFSMQVRIRRFDGNYRWFYTRAVGSRDIRGVIVQWYGSHMDIHDQHIAEVKAARQEEIEASEAKHRQLANLIPQIIFAATEDEGVTFANEQWLAFTGQDFNDALGLGFMDFVHPDDLARCHIPVDLATPSQIRQKKPHEPSRNPSETSSAGISHESSTISETATEITLKGIHQAISRNNSSSSSTGYELPTADLSELARAGVIKVAIDSNGRLSYTTEVRLRSKTGEYRWHLVRCVEVDNINLGSRDGSWFGACTDINDHKLLETKLKEAMDSKGKFLSNMSHEIRTPLIGISGMVNFLQDTVLNDEQLDYTNTIQSSASSLLNIINDILDLSKVDAGMMKLSYEWFHTRSLVEEVNEMVSTMAITKRLELNYVVDIDVPEMVKGDKFRIRQVLLNVIGNAIKFTTVGEVFSRCRVVTSTPDIAGENEIMLEYSIIDTGRGFTQEEADLIFKPFSQIDGSSTRQHGGSGLGLVISRQLVELHGGKMEGSAVPGEGSIFTFTAKFGLPTPEDHPEPVITPALSMVPSTTSSVSTDASAHAVKLAGGNPILANKLVQSPATISPKTESSVESSGMVSSASSDPYIHSRSQNRSSGSSNAQSSPRFDEAAQISRADLLQMKLALPDKPTQLPSSASQAELVAAFQYAQIKSEGATPTPKSVSISGESRHSSTSPEPKSFRPPLYSILLVCPQTHSREATTQHIEITLPKDVPHQITPLSSVAEAQELISGDKPIIFTHVVLNLGSTEEIVTLIEQIITSTSFSQTTIVILSDPVQRQEVIKMAAVHGHEQLGKGNRITFIYKPVKPSRFAVIFDPDKERDLSIDRNRSTAQLHVANQKQNYLEVGKRLGNRGLRVLLVEDNLVNQKVLLKFLAKVGIAVELAMDGVECTEKVFCRPHSFYSLILVSYLSPSSDNCL